MRISDWSSDVCSSDLNSVASVGGLRRMCGIVGFIGSRPAVPVLMEGLRRLEYRGYDSAGVATLTNGSISRRRAVGKVASLQELMDREPLEGTIGIVHPPWGPHGRPPAPKAQPPPTH